MPTPSPLICGVGSKAKCPSQAIPTKEALSHGQLFRTYCRRLASAGAFIRIQTTTGRGRCMARSEEHTSELQSLMRISYAVFCLKKKNTNTHIIIITHSLNYYTEFSTVI